MCRDEYLNWLRVPNGVISTVNFGRLPDRSVFGLALMSATPIGCIRLCCLVCCRTSVVGTNAGRSDRRTRVEYQGARGARFEVVPGSAIGRAGSEWVVAAEVVETDRLRARRVSAIQPEWIEPIAGDSVLPRTGTRVERHIWSSGDSRSASRSTGLQSSRDVASHCRQSTRSLLAHVYREGAHCW